MNRVILDYAHSPVGLINDLTAHIVAAGGKRLRPSLTLAASKLCGYAGERHLALAAAVEFIHTATLLHEDVVDASALRRGTATANAVWGNASSVLVGDFLFSRSFQLMVADGSLEVLKALSDASAIIASGEVQQLMVSHDLAITQAVYEEVIGAKTAALFAAACEIGAIVAEKPDWRAPLRRYGQALGMAFQIADDALDYAADAEALGKTIGDDFTEGKVTLPIILALRQADAGERQFWEVAFSTENTLAPETLAQAQALLKKHGAVAQTLAVAQTFAAEAEAALAPFPDSLAKTALVEAARFAVARGY